MKVKPIKLIVCISVTVLLSYPILIAFSMPGKIVDSSVSSAEGLRTKHIDQKHSLVHFPDKGLESAIREHIGRPQGDISAVDVDRITFLEISHKNIFNLEGIQHLTGLEVLNLYHNEINDISPLKNLTNLKSLNLSYNQIQDISPVMKFTSLYELILDSNKITDITPLGNLVNLKRLSLYNNRIKNIQPLTSLSNLVDLDLHINQVESIKPLEKLNNLCKLSIGSNNISDMTPLAKLTKLTVLQASQNKISNLEGIGSLINLEELHLDSNEIEKLDELKPLKKLSYLSLSENKIMSIAPLSYLVNLADLDLDKNRIIDVTGLESLKLVKALRLSENRIKDIMSLGSLAELTSLAINNNDITNVDELIKLSKLGFLDISNNKISDIGNLRKMPNLSLGSIRLGGNPLPEYILNDALKEQFILSEISPHIAKAIETYYGEPKQYMDEGITGIEKNDAEYRIRIRLSTFTGAHNPPYGNDTMTVIKDNSGFRVENFEHEEVPAWKTYCNEEYHISFKYPPDWVKNTKYMERYDGKEGYFSINAVTGGAYLEPLPIDEVVKVTTEHKTKPYGFNQQITHLKIKGQEARLIFVSSDQPGSENNQSRLIVKYPGPITINGNIYHYFTLDADRSHIMDIARSIKFIY